MDQPERSLASGRNPSESRTCAVTVRKFWAHYQSQKPDRGEHFSARPGRPDFVSKLVLEINVSELTSQHGF
jgi:hypothetical protein